MGVSAPGRFAHLSPDVRSSPHSLVARTGPTRRPAMSQSMAFPFPCNDSATREFHLPVYIRHGVRSNNLVRTAWRFLETRNTPECVCVFLLAGSELFCLAHPVFSLVALIPRQAGGFCDFWGFLDLLEREPGIGRGKDMSQICLLKSCVAERFKVSITIVSQLSNTLTATLRQCL